MTLKWTEWQRPGSVSTIKKFLAQPFHCFPFCRSAVLHLPEVWLHHANRWVQYQETASHQLRGDAKRKQFSEDRDHELGEVVCPHLPSPHCCMCAQGAPQCAEGSAAEFQGGQVQGPSSETIPLTIQLSLISLILSPAACWNHREQSTFFFLLHADEAWYLNYKHLPQRLTDYLSSPILEWKR